MIRLAEAQGRLRRRCTRRPRGGLHRRTVSGRRLGPITVINAFKPARRHQPVARAGLALGFCASAALTRLTAHARRWRRLRAPLAGAAGLAFAGLLVNGLVQAGGLTAIVRRVSSWGHVEVGARPATSFRTGGRCSNDVSFRHRRGNHGRPGRARNGAGKTNACSGWSPVTFRHRKARRGPRPAGLRCHCASSIRHGPEPRAITPMVRDLAASSVSHRRRRAEKPRPRLDAARAGP